MQSFSTSIIVKVSDNLISKLGESQVRRKRAGYTESSNWIFRRLDPRLSVLYLYLVMLPTDAHSTGLV